MLAVLAALMAGSACREAPPVLRVACQGDTAFRQALEMATDTIERSGSPVRVELVFEETLTWTPADVVRAAHGLCRDPDLLGVIGFTSSDASLAAARVFNRYSIPLIIPTATSPKLMHTGSWTFKLCPNDAHQACFLANQAWNTLGARRCALIFQNNDYGRGLADLFQEEWVNRGGEITFAAMAGSGFTDQDVLQLYIRGIIESAPDLLLLICQPQQALRAKEELVRLHSALPLLGSDSMSTVHTLKQAALLDGLPMALYYHHDLSWPGDNGFARAFREKTTRPPSYQSALAYDALMLLHQAVLEGARTREEIREFLASLSDDHRPFKGVAGPISFNNLQEVVRQPVLGILRDGELMLEPTGKPALKGNTR